MTPCAVCALLNINVSVPEASVDRCGPLFPLQDRRVRIKKHSSMATSNLIRLYLSAVTSDLKLNHLIINKNRSDSGAIQAPDMLWNCSDTVSPLPQYLGKCAVYFMSRRKKWRWVTSAPEFHHDTFLNRVKLAGTQRERTTEDKMA